MFGQMKPGFTGQEKYGEGEKHDLKDPTLSAKHSAGNDMVYMGTYGSHWNWGINVYS